MKQRAVHNTITLLFFNILFWVCNLYPRHIIEFGHAGLSVRATVLNLLYHILYFGFLAIFVSKGRTLFSEYYSDVGQTLIQKLCFVKVTVLILERILFDSVYFLIAAVSGSVSYILSDILTVLSWLFIYYVLKFDNKTTHLNKKVSAVLAILTVLAVCGCLAFDVGLFMKYTAFEVKHDPLIFSQLQPVKNLNYLHTRSDFVLDTWFGCMLIAFFTVKISNDSHESHPIAKFILSLFIQFEVLLGIFIVLVFFKAFVYGDRTIDSVGSRSSGKYGSIPVDGCFSSSWERFYITRFDKYAEFRGNDVYLTKKATIYFHTEDKRTKMLSFNLDEYPQWRDDSVKDEPVNAIVIHSDMPYLKKRFVGKQAVYLFGNSAICYVQDGKPFVIDFKEIANLTDNAIVTVVCEQLIGEGNIAAFEYGAEYLYKYDKDFILPYLERYAAENFGEEEQKSLAELFYKSEYIAGIAKKILK